MREVAAFFKGCANDKHAEQKQHDLPIYGLQGESYGYLAHHENCYGSSGHNLPNLHLHA